MVRPNLDNPSMRQIVSSQTKDNVGSEDRIDPPYLATLVISVILGDLVALVTKRFSVVREILGGHLKSGHVWSLENRP